MAEALRQPREQGSLSQVEHVVVLMQENRSFDHYYGTMAGVRGFGDRRALRLPPGGSNAVLQAVTDGMSTGGVGADLGSGSAGTGSAGGSATGSGTGSAGSSATGSGAGGPSRNVFHQPDAFSSTGFLLPWHVDTLQVDGQDLGDLPHDWNTTHVAWNGGAYNSWLAAKSKMSMGYLTATDIPFHRALASAFTVCDHYFSSIQGPTTPNRLYHWTGTIDPAGAAGGPATSNPADYKPVYNWTTYPERLQQAGVSWQVYSNNQSGGDFLGDYGDNPLWLFQAYHDAFNSTDPAVKQLADRANLTGTGMTPAPAGVTGTDVDYVLAQFIGDCAANTLPQVSWVVAPYGYSEHPAARPADGAAYVQRVLKALWDNPKLWASTILLINYDENDGFFDHLVPPTAPPGTPGEILNGSALAGMLNSGSSATGSAAAASLVDAAGQLLSGPMPIGLGPRVPMTVISPWSRGGWVNSQVFDHTSVLRFLEQWTGVAEPNISPWRRAVCGDLTSCFDFGSSDTTIPLLPDANSLRAQAAGDAAKPKPAPPAPGTQQPPVQEPGTAKARPLPYQPTAWVETATGSTTVRFGNQGNAAMSFQTYAYHANEIRQTLVLPGATGQEQFSAGGPYDVAVHGPNGFLVEAAGAAGEGPAVSAAVTGTTQPAFVVTVQGSVPVTVSGGTAGPVSGNQQQITATADNGWYDLTLTLPGSAGWIRHFAGHLENGLPSVTG
ncbi:phosphocholine-specific phospholipase C [Nocardia stercoris]|uniref:Phospholipase C, phosphocholine-specific n=1 Tax=Nocardia stercoris TaxID=2483361 RepID=A0A3M2KXE5_9NOCA|nr:phospholipase C, phosphocholine-specific [Nocardia stercoris]